MVYNLFLNENFLANPLMRPVLTSWQQAQTQQMQLFMQQYQFWQRLGMQTMVASQQFWLPTAPFMFGMNANAPSAFTALPLSNTTRPTSHVANPDNTAHTNPASHTNTTLIQPAQPANIAEQAGVAISQDKIAQGVETRVKQAIAPLTSESTPTISQKPSATPTKTASEKKDKTPQTVAMPQAALPKLASVNEAVKQANLAVTAPATKPTAKTKTAVPKVKKALLKTITAAQDTLIVPEPKPKPLPRVANEAPVSAVKQVLPLLSIDINNATAAQLVQLDGINRKKAQDIISYRETTSSFAHIDDLAKVKGIGQSTVDKNRESIAIHPLETKISTKIDNKKK